MTPSQTSKSRMRSFRLDHDTEAALKELAQRTGQRETTLVKAAIRERLAGLNAGEPADLDLLTEIESRRGKPGSGFYPRTPLDAPGLRARIDSHLEEIGDLLDNLDARDSASATEAAFLMERAASVWQANRLPTKRTSK